MTIVERANLQQTRRVRGGDYSLDTRRDVTPRPIGPGREERAVPVTKNRTGESFVGAARDRLRRVAVRVMKNARAVVLLHTLVSTNRLPRAARDPPTTW